MENVMRLLIKLKLIALIAIWSLICLGLYLVVALGEAMLEISADAASAVVGQGGAASGLVDLTGDIVQWGVGLVWVAGAGALWFVKQRLTARRMPLSATGVATTTVPPKAAPHAIDRRHPAGPAAAAANGPAARILGGMMARKRQKP
jgi:hypothetical protein